MYRVDWSTATSGIYTQWFYTYEPALKFAKTRWAYVIYGPDGKMSTTSMRTAYRPVARRM